MSLEKLKNDYPVFNLLSENEFSYLDRGVVLVDMKAIKRIAKEIVEGSRLGNKEAAQRLLNSSIN